MRISDWSSDVCSSDLPRWIVRDEGIEVDLNVRNIFPILDVIHDDMGSLSRSFAANHFEAAGEVKGEARIGGKRIAIDGLYYRDHSSEERRVGTDWVSTCRIRLGTVI